jgi:hypothetical protein
LVATIDSGGGGVGAGRQLACPPADDFSLCRLFCYSRYTCIVPKQYQLKIVHWSHGAEYRYYGSGTTKTHIFTVWGFVLLMHSSEYRYLTVSSTLLIVEYWPGHQNQNQKIQHVVKIKQENVELKAEVTALKDQLLKYVLSNRSFSYVYSF